MSTYQTQYLFQKSAKFSPKVTYISDMSPLVFRKLAQHWCCRTLWGLFGRTRRRPIFALFFAVLCCGNGTKKLKVTQQLFRQIRTTICSSPEQKIPKTYRKNENQDDMTNYTFLDPIQQLKNMDSWWKKAPANIWTKNYSLQNGKKANKI